MVEPGLASGAPKRIAVRSHQAHGVGVPRIGVGVGAKGRGEAGGRLAAARQDQRAMEKVRVQSEAASLWRTTFDATDANAPDNFAELANRAIAESASNEPIADDESPA